MSLEEVTLDRVTKGNVKFVFVLLRVVYHEMKKMTHGNADRKEWWKAVVRMVDKKGQGLYAEVKGSQKEVQQRLEVMMKSKLIHLTGVEIKQGNPYLSGFSADLSRNGKISTVAEAHPSIQELLKTWPVAKCSFGDLQEHCQGYDRMDVIGKVTYKEVPGTRTPKVTLWMKDESKVELAVHLWGSRFVEKASSVSEGSVVQLDNVLVSKKPDGSIEASGEDWRDSAKNFLFPACRRHQRTASDGAPGADRGTWFGHFDVLVAVGSQTCQIRWW